MWTDGKKESNLGKCTSRAYETQGPGRKYELM
jgi:hypothetical protein